MYLSATRRQNAVVVLLQQVLITQIAGRYMAAYPFNINLLGASSITLPCVVALANGTTITCELRLDQGYA